MNTCTKLGSLLLTPSWSYRFSSRCFASNISTRRRYSLSCNRNDANKSLTFQDLLKSSPLMSMGLPNGKAVVGVVTHVCNNDLYVDFGGKFEAVVNPNPQDSREYNVGSKVRLILNRFEMTGKYLGEDHHITLCEAEAILLGPYETVAKEQ